MLKKLLLSFLIVFILLPTFLVPVAHAQSTWYNQGPYEWYMKVYDPEISDPSEIFGERYTAAQVQWVIYSVLTFPSTLILKPALTACLVSALDPNAAVDWNECLEGVMNLGTSQTPEIQHYANVNPKPQRTLVQEIFKERGFSGISYVKAKIRKLKLIPEAKAQGFGFTTALNPFVTTWQISRNTVYGLFVITAVILAFMIMFRVKLSPQTVITVQSAIPKLVIAVLLVTFSYAIAGFLVDLMYLVIGILSIFGAGAVEEIVGTNDISPVNVYNLLTTGDLSSGSSLGAGGLFLTYIYIFVLTIATTISRILAPVTQAVNEVLDASHLFAFINVGAQAISGFIGIILLVISVVVLIFMVFKTFMMLFKAFVNIILLTIFAPFQILIGVFSARVGFGAWVKSFVSNLAVFVVTGGLFLFALIFLMLAMGDAFPSALFDELPVSALVAALFATPQTGFNPAPTVVGWPPLISSGSTTTGFLYISVSFVIFSMIPKTAEIVQSALAGKPFAYGAAVGEAVGPLGTIQTGRAQYASTREQQEYAEYQRQQSQPGGTYSRWTELRHRAAEARRAMSGGKIK